MIDFKLPVRDEHIPGVLYLIREEIAKHQAEIAKLDQLIDQVQGYCIHLNTIEIIYDPEEIWDRPRPRWTCLVCGAKLLDGR